MNIKLLLRIQKQILKEPRQFQMEELFISRLYGIKIPNCGTAACIAGWAACITRDANPAETRMHVESWRVAQTEIGLDYLQSSRLFFFSEWPAQFRKHTKEGTPAFARQAVKRIEHFIKTKGAE